MKQIFMNLLALGSLLSSVLVITSKNPVIAVIFLISVFCNAAGYLILLGIGFIGISYILIYIGAITILFLFTIMMINIKLTDILEIGSQYTKSIPLAFAIGCIFIYEFFTITPFSINDVSILSYFISSLNNFNGILLNSNSLASELVYFTINPAIADTTFTNFTQIQAIGINLYTLGAVWLIVTAIILLLAMVAPIFITKTANNQNLTSNQISNFNNKKNLTPNTKGNKLNYVKAGYHSSAMPLVISSNFKLNPWAVTGLTDAEGCFTFTVHRRKDRKLGFEVRARFAIHMHSKDHLLLLQLKEFFGLGNVYISKQNSASFIVSSKEEIAILIKHFESYPLQTSKLYNFYIFKLAFEMFCKKEHLTKDGLLKILSYINCLNKPFEAETLNLITSVYGPLPQVILPPIVKQTIIYTLNPWWIVGFVSGEGCFSYKQKINKETGKTFIYFTMFINQLKFDKHILESIAFYFSIEKVYAYREVAHLEINNLKKIQHIILPFFTIYPLIGNKKKQYLLWLEAITLTLSNSKYSKEREIKLLNLVKTLSELTGYKR